jgi:hypothetical protein
MASGVVVVDPPADYEAWAKSKQGGGGAATSFE